MEIHDIAGKPGDVIIDYKTGTVVGQIGTNGGLAGMEIIDRYCGDLMERIYEKYPAQEPFRINVYSPDTGECLQEWEITLRNGDVSYSTITDISGVATFYIPPGEYTIVILDNGRPLTVDPPTLTVNEGENADAFIYVEGFIY